jgi:hypothetical protein
LDKGTTLPSLVKKDLITITMSYPKSKEEQKCNNGLSIVPFLPITVVPFSQIYLSAYPIILPALPNTGYFPFGFKTSF